MMGFAENEVGEYWEKWSTPQHKVQLPAFQISRYPITNAQFACFVNAGGYQDESYWLESKGALEWLRGEKADLSLVNDKPKIKQKYEEWLSEEKTRRQPWFWGQRQWNIPNYPVVGVSWYEAQAFCNWLNRQRIFKDQIVRLPTEAEWEYTAGGLQGLRYAWGNEIDEVKGNFNDAQIGEASAVGLFPPCKAFLEHGVMLYDLSGNVWEWTSSQWGYKVSPPDFGYEHWFEQESLRDNLNIHALRVVRGGAWTSDSRFVKCAHRNWEYPSYRLNHLGFRVVLTR